MNTLKTLYVFLAFSLITTVSFAQTYSDSATSIEGFEQVNSEKNFLSSQNTQTTTDASGSNSVFIQQVGNDNEVTARITSQTSDVQFVQIGDDNDVYVNLRGNSVQEKVLQNGNRNSFLNFTSRGGVESLQGEIIQNGNNQNLTWYGENSISEKLKVTMQGETGQSVIVRNF